MTAQQFIDNTFNVIDEIENTRIISNLEEMKTKWESKKTMKKYDVELILININKRIKELSQ